MKVNGRTGRLRAEIEPVTAELWDGPASTAVTVFEFGKAFVTGAQPALGQNRKVTVRM